MPGNLSVRSWRMMGNMGVGFCYNRIDRNDLEELGLRSEHVVSFVGRGICGIAGNE